MEQMNNTGLGQLLEVGAKDFVDRCTNCGDCLRACPMFPLMKFADSGPEAVMEKITQLLKKGEVSEEACEMIWSCNGQCSKCIKSCPQGLMLSSALITFARVKLFSAGKKPPHEMHVRMAGHRCSLANVLPALQIKPSEEHWIKKAPAKPEPVDVVFFPSCSGMVLPNVLLDIDGILERMGVNFVSLRGGNLCCGTSALIPAANRQSTIRIIRCYATGP